MNYNVKATPKFQKELKRLSKKYSSLKFEFAILIQNLKTNPLQGVALGKDCYKIRLPIASKGKGKSGGARVITCVRIVEEIVYLLTIFDKSEKEAIQDSELQALLKLIE